MNTTKTITNGLFWKILERIAIQGVSFIMSIFVARIVDTSDYGIIALVSVIIDITSVFINSGLGLGLIQDNNVNDNDFSSVFSINLIVSLIIYFFIFALAPFISNFYRIAKLKEILRIYSLALPITCLYQTEILYANKNLKFKKVFISSFVGVAFSGMISLFMAVSGFGIWSLVAQYLLNLLITGLVLSYENHFIPRIIIKSKVSNSIIKFGLEIAGADFAIAIFNSMNQLIIGKRYSEDTLAYYDKGKYIPFLFDNNVGTSIASVFFPVLSIEKENNEKLVTIAKETTSIETYIMSPIYLGLIAVSYNMVNCLLTEKWIGCVPYIIVFSIAGMFATLGPIDIEILKSKGKTADILKMEFIKKPIWLLLTIIALRYNAMILAFVSAFMVFVETCINSVLVNKYIKYSLFAKLKIWIASIVPSIPMFIIVSLMNMLKINSIILLLLQCIAGLLIFIIYSSATKNCNFNKIVEIVKSKI